MKYFIKADDMSRWRRFWTMGYYAYSGDVDAKWPSSDSPWLIGVAMTRWGAHRLIRRHRRDQAIRDHGPRIIMHTED